MLISKENIPFNTYLNKKQVKRKKTHVFSLFHYCPINNTFNMAAAVLTSVKKFINLSFRHGLRKNTRFKDQIEVSCVNFSKRLLEVDQHF